MTKNVGSTDKIVRYVIAAAMIGLYYTDKLPAPYDIVALVVAVIALGTALINFCPLWAVFGVNTNKK